MLKKDGTWVINFRVFTYSEEEQHEFLYEDIAEVQSVLTSLAGRPKVMSDLPEDKTKEDILLAMEQTSNRIWQRIKTAKVSKPSF